MEERLRVRRRLNLHAKHNPGVIVPRVTPPTIDVDDTILDSGASRPLLARKYVELFPQRIKETSQVVDLITAAGPETCNETITYRNADAGEDVVALILPDKPSVLSLGMCIIDMGWHFEWPSYSFAPFAIKPHGTIVWLVVRDYVLYFRRSQDLSLIHI